MSCEPGFELSFNTGIFAVAKSKIEKRVLLTVLRLLARCAEEAVLEKFLHFGRRNIFLVDGPTFNMHDSVTNQQVYLQPKGKKEGIANSHT
ncbi:MAG: hypothetical protein LBC02_09585 [Planctomycetaceae bacterium]|nr:hypothetical protein [Planctomycetaceae bacterium]